MKKLVYGLLAGLVLGVGYLAVAHFSGGAFPTLGLPLGGDLSWLRDHTTSFWEDIQFKDFVRAATYHTEDRQAGVDIPFLLERLFMIKPEALDIMSYEIVLAEVDSTGLRARVKTRIKFKDLLRDKVEEKEVVLYWHREALDTPWYMELETSLREIEAEKGKKH